MRTLTTLGLLCVVISPVYAQPMGILTGEIKDPQGAVLIDAVIIVHADGSLARNGKKIEAKYEDFKINPSPSSGEFKMKLPAGYYYDVMVSRQGFRPQCAKVYILRMQPNKLDFTLQIAPTEPLMPPE